MDSFLEDELEVEKQTDEVITERIGEVMEEVGLSIFLTSATTVFAFCLGCASAIPGIRWVCLCKSTRCTLAKGCIQRRVGHLTL